jgi:carbon storage regulator CsrA
MMLVLTRRIGERVVVEITRGECQMKITILVTSITCDDRGRQVRLGFEAPKEAIILREELIR